MKRDSVNKAVCNAEYLRIFSGEEANGPITTVEQSFWTKRLQRDIKIWREVMLLPHVPIRLGYQSREFADYIFML